MVVLDELEKIVASVSDVAINPVLGTLIAHLKHCIENGSVLVVVKIMHEQ